MNVNFDALDMIPTMLKLLEQLSEEHNNHVDKKWLSTQETAEYLGYTKKSIDAKVRSNEFILDLHYYQKSSKRMFDKNMLDKWVIGMDMIDVYKSNSTINNLIEEISA